VTRIVFDASSLDAAPSGSKTRLLRLAPALRARGHDVAIVVGDPGVLDATGLPAIAFPGRPSGPLGRRLRPRALARVLASHPAPDVVVSETWPAPRVDAPLIAVVHDLRHVRAGGLRARIATAWLRDAARRARRLHAVSEATRSELAAAVPEASGRIDVVPNAVVIPAPSGASLPAGVREPFVFVAGHSEPRKRWPLVARAAAELAARGIAVVRAGRGAEPHPGVTDLGIVSDDVRDALFRRATVVLAPSALEGFGLVPLEALAAGARVVASRIPAHVEVLGGAADFFDPDDRAAAVALLIAAHDASPADREARARIAIARASQWSPARAADAFEASLRAAGIG
jgi:glycosyltransferase involved in cell wall biosynthesis